MTRREFVAAAAASVQPGTCTKVTIDSAHAGGRQMYLIDIAAALR